jgi:hypothetical protein
MATKRTVPGQKASGHELSSALTTYKEINSALAMPCPPIHEFRSMNDALSAYISLSKILAAKVQEMLEVPLHVELQEKIDKLKSQLIDEVIAY